MFRRLLGTAVERREENAAALFRVEFVLDPASRTL
jgi:hypothetical protein